MEEKRECVDTGGYICMLGTWNDVNENDNDSLKNLFFPSLALVHYLTKCALLSNEKKK